MNNLAEQWDDFTDEEKAFMLEAWNKYSQNKIAIGMLPFVNQRAMRQAVIEYPTEMLKTIQVDILNKFLEDAINGKSS